MNKQVSNSMKTQNRIFALLIVLVQLGIMFAYGFGTKFTTFAVQSPLVDYSSDVLFYTFAALLAILGYGLIISYSENSAISGLTITLIVLSISVQATPLLLQFWRNVLFHQGPGPDAQLSLNIQSQTMALCSSSLLSFAAFSGRLANVQILLATVFYNIGWTFSYQLTKYLQQTKGTSASSAISDDYGTNYVYVFAGFFALCFSFLANLQKGKNSPVGSRHSAFISMIGTGFIFACFPFSGIFSPNTAATNIFRITQGPMNIYFTLTASVISTYIFGAIFGKFKIGVRESIVGVISGGVTIAVVGGTISNIGACIAIGAFSGLISALYLGLILKNSQFFQKIDHLGIIGPILFCSIFGGFALSPILYASYKDLSKTTSASISVTTNQIIYYQLVNFGVAAGTAIFTGFLSGVFPFCFRKIHKDDDFNYSKVVGYDFGLFKHDQAQDKYANKTDGI